jgi:hypothetical protein
MRNEPTSARIKELREEKVIEFIAVTFLVIIVTATIIIAGYVIYLAGDLAINGVNAPHYQVTCYSEGRRIYSGELQRMGENSDVWESDGNRVVLPGDCIYFQIDK